MQWWRKSTEFPRGPSTERKDVTLDHAPGGQRAWPGPFQGPMFQKRRTTETASPVRKPDFVVASRTAQAPWLSTLYALAVGVVAVLHAGKDKLPQRHELPLFFCTASEMRQRNRAN
jgi:hypothetical protein